jgi:hypothetical protein
MYDGVGLRPSDEGVEEQADEDGGGQVAAHQGLLRVRDGRGRTESLAGAASRTLRNGMITRLTAARRMPAVLCSGSRTPLEFRAASTVT